MLIRLRIWRTGVTRVGRYSDTLTPVALGATGHSLELLLWLIWISSGAKRIARSDIVARPPLKLEARVASQVRIGTKPSISVLNLVQQVGEFISVIWFEATNLFVNRVALNRNSSRVANNPT